MGVGWGGTRIFQVTPQVSKVSSKKEQKSHVDQKGEKFCLIFHFQHECKL